MCYECLATRCGGHNEHDLCDLLEAAAWLQSVLADLQATLVSRLLANEQVLARYVGAIIEPAQYLFFIYVRLSANECAARLADPLLIERTCNLMCYTLEPFCYAHCLSRSQHAQRRRRLRYHRRLPRTAHRNCTQRATFGHRRHGVQLEEARAVLLY